MGPPSSDVGDRDRWTCLQRGRSVGSVVSLVTVEERSVGLLGDSPTTPTRLC